MRRRAYWVFALVAWPAAVWGCIEVVLRLATGETGGLWAVSVLTVCALGTILGARWRTAAAGM
jgi:hypothetical protein